MSAPKPKSTLAEDYANLQKLFPITASLPLLLEESGRKYADCQLRFSEPGKSYPAHKIILSASIEGDLSDAGLAVLATKAPLDAHLESFVLGCLYGLPLPDTVPIGLLDALKVFVRAHYTCFLTFQPVLRASISSHASFPSSDTPPPLWFVLPLPLLVFIK